MAPSENNAVNNINPPLWRVFIIMEEYKILLRQRQKDNKEMCFFPSWPSF